MQVKHYMISILTIFTGLFVANQASALTYQSETDVDFTINPTINITLTGGDLKIEDLTPGSYADSNIITVGVNTNAGFGYYLSATAGTSSTDTDLTNADNGNYVFTNLTDNETALSNFDDNHWGYSYSTDSGSTWISGSQGSAVSGYNGLPLDGETGVTLIDTTDYINSNSIQFKIGAKASAAQASGEYTNTINFYAVTYAEPMTFNKAFAAAGKTKTNGYYVMQDASSSICSAVDEGQTTTLLDPRGDGETYTVAKLKDGKCWMIENLNLAGNTALSADNTDVTSDYISSFSTSNNLTKEGDTIKLPASSTSGFYFGNNSYVYNSGNKTNNCADPGCYSYYSWDAATLGSGRTISTDNTDAPYSICPKGWKLPTSRTTSVSNWQTTSDFYVLAHQYGLDSTTSTEESDNGFYIQAGPGTTPNFLLAGYFYDGSFRYGGSNGRYWSSTSSSSVNARNVYFDASTIVSANNLGREFGFSVRCLAK